MRARLLKDLFPFKQNTIFTIENNKIIYEPINEIQETAIKLLNLMLENNLYEGWLKKIEVNKRDVIKQMTAEEVYKRARKDRIMHKSDFIRRYLNFAKQYGYKIIKDNQYYIGIPKSLLVGKDIFSLYPKNHIYAGLYCYLHPRHWPVKDLASNKVIQEKYENEIEILQEKVKIKPIMYYTPEPHILKIIHGKILKNL